MYIQNSNTIVYKMGGTTICLLVQQLMMNNTGTVVQESTAIVAKLGGTTTEYKFHSLFTCR